MHPWSFLERLLDPGEPPGLTQERLGKPPGPYRRSVKKSPLFTHSHILYIFAYFYIFFTCFSTYFDDFLYNIDRVMDGGRLRRPPLINYQFYIKKIIEEGV